MLSTGKPDWPLCGTCSSAYLAPDRVHCATRLANANMSDQTTQGTHPEVNSEDVVARIGNAIGSHLEQASEEERQRCVEQIANWCAERERDRREDYASRVARGAPAPSEYTPLYTGTPPRAASSHPSAKADTATARNPDQTEHGYTTPPRSTKATTPLPPKRRRKTKGRAQEQGENTGFTTTEEAGSEHGLLDRMD